MRAVAPRLDGLHEVTLAEDQHEFLSIVAGVIDYPNGARWWVTRWRLSDEGREKVARGEDVYLIEI